MKAVLRNLPTGSGPGSRMIRRQVWEVRPETHKRRGYGRSIKAAEADVMDDLDRVAKFGHLDPPRRVR